jgi:hypothetical protein
MAMKQAIVHIKGADFLGQGQPIKSVPKEKEAADVFEDRCWIERGHFDEDGNMFHPGIAFKKSIDTAARYLRMRIPGKDRSEYGKHFKGGVIAIDDIKLGVTRDEVLKTHHRRVFVPHNGKSGGGTRVWRCFPYAPKWEGKLTFYIVDDIITEEVFEKHIREAGKFIGVGVWRPENGGMWGRFSVEKIEWSEVTA